MHYAISGADEARAYLDHPVLGPRLVEAAAAVLAAPGNDAAAIMGDIDAVKLRSSMTLFDATSDEPIFGRVLERFFGGQADPATRARLGG